MGRWLHLRRAHLSYTPMDHTCGILVIFSLFYEGTPPSLGFYCNYLSFSHGFGPMVSCAHCFAHGIVSTHGFLHMVLEGCLSYIKKALLSFVTRVWRIRDII
jgi:hypothetical protein